MQRRVALSQREFISSGEIPQLSTEQRISSVLRRRGVRLRDTWVFTLLYGEAGSLLGGERQRNRPEVAIVIHTILSLVLQFSISGIDLLRAGV